MGILIGVLVSFLVWILLSYFVRGRVKATEVAAVVWGHKYVGAVAGGRRFIPWFPGYYLDRVSTGWFKIEIPPVEAYSKAGEIEVGGKTIRCGIEPMVVDSTIPIRFPQPATDQVAKEHGKPPEKKWQERLMRVLVALAGIPRNNEGLTTCFKEDAMGIARTVIGETVWETVTENLEKVRKKADRRFKGKESVFKNTGFEDCDFTFTIERAELPEWLKKGLSRIDEERIRAEAAEFVAKRQARERIGPVLEAFADSRGKTVTEIQQQIEDDPKLQKDFLNYIKELNLRLEEADRGALVDIRVEGAKGLGVIPLEVVALFKKLGGSLLGSSEGRKSSDKKTIQGGQGGIEELDDAFGNK